MTKVRAVLFWAALSLACAVPLAFALTSPLLAWRDPMYIVSGVAGVICLILLLAQPLLIGRKLPGISTQVSKTLHRWCGVLLVGGVLAHVVGLWLTSPPDVVDALLFASPTPFSAWGVIAMWAVFAASTLALLRRKIGLRSFRAAHALCALIIVVSTVIHAVQIEGTMEPVSKFVLCALVFLATIKTIADLRGWSTRIRRTVAIDRNS